MMEKKYNYIVIEGNIGAGKTTLSSIIAERYNAHLLLERFADNPFLPKFYEEPDRYAFPLELSFLAGRYKQLKEEFDSVNLFKEFMVADYYFAKSLVFASSTLGSDEYALYRQIFYMVYGSLPKPELIVYLHKNPDRLLEYIALRGRSYEKNITAGYLKKIEESYFHFFKQNPDNKYVIIDTNDIDFVDNPQELERLINIIFLTDHNKGLNRLFL
jgi:deoxyadenosine/deoxycytidine kinase